MIEYNRFGFIGKVLKKVPQSTGSGRDFISIYLECEKAGRNGQPAKDHFEVTAWSDYMKKALEDIPDGTQCLIEGRVSSNAFTGRDGKRRLAYTFIADRIAKDTETLQPQTADDYYHSTPTLEITEDDLPF